MRVFICSPFRASASRTEEQNKANAVWMSKLAMSQGHDPFAPHLLYPQFLDDSVKSERESGIRAGTAFLKCCDEMWILVPPEGMTEGMRHEYEFALDHCPGITYRVFGLQADGNINMPVDDFGVS